MKNALIIILGLLMAACSGEREPAAGSATLSGRIINPAIQSITLSGMDLLQKVPLDSGAFTITIDLPEAGYFKWWHDRHQVLLFLAPGMNINMEVDAAKFDGSLTFTGPGAAENDRLFRQQLQLDRQIEQMSRARSLYSRDEASFLEAMASLYDPLREELEANASKFHPAFVKLERLRLTYEQANQLLDYPALHAKTTKDADFTPSAAYERFLSELDPNDPEALKTGSFRDFLPRLISSKAGSENPSPDESLRQGFDFVEKHFTAPSVRDYAIFALTRQAIRRDGAHILPATIDAFKKQCHSRELVSDIEQEYAKWRPLTPGQPFGEYSLLDLQGAPKTLEPLRSKYVLLEVWASWCGVCRAEYPYLENLQKKLANQENLAFAGISIDENEAPWRRLVQNRQMHGLHLLTPGGWGSPLCQHFQINSLPRFILLDPQGRIIDYDAPRPSSGQLEGILTELTASR